MLPVPGPHMGGHGPPMMQMRGPPPHGMMPGGEIVAPTLKLYIVDVNIFLIGIGLKIYKFSPAFTQCVYC